MKKDRIKRHTYPGHHMELLHNEICINCGADMAYKEDREEFNNEFGQWEEVKDAEKIYDLLHEKDKYIEMYNKFQPQITFDEAIKIGGYSFSKYKIENKDGKEIYLLWTKPQGRDHHYLFIKKHWDCKRIFPFPNKYANDFYPKRLPTREEYEGLFDKANARYKENGIHSFAQAQDLWE